ncbi:unnamed protein product [Ophioblennius macclurei]
MEETSYPKMRRPKRQLCYVTGEDGPPKQWKELLTLEDVDRMFDDLDSPSQNFIPSPSSPCQNFCPGQDLPETELSPILQVGHQMVPDEDDLQTVSRSVCHKLDVDLDVPFEVHELVKTSSPIEEIMSVRPEEKLHDEKAVPEVLLHVEDEAQNSEPPPSEKVDECNGQVTEESGISALETPPKEFTFPKSASKKTKPEASQRQEDTELPAVVSREEPPLPTSDKNPETLSRKPPVETTSHVGNNMMTFLQKLKEGGQSKLASTRKPVFPVQVSAPEPEDDFVILEEDTTFQFTIPSKNAPSKRQKQSRTSSSDKDSSTDKEKPQNQEDMVEANDEPRSQKTKAKKKRKGENNEERPESAKDEMLQEQAKPNKNNKVQSKVHDKAGSETQPSSPVQKTETKTLKSRKAQKEKLKADNESVKTSRAKPSKGTRRRLPISDVNEMDVDIGEKQDDEPVDFEDRCSPPENVTSDANGNAKQSKPTTESAAISSEDDKALQKRKRKTPGQWWMTAPSSDETNDQLPAVKKSKQKSKELNVAALSPAKDKTDKVLKKRTQNEKILSSQHAGKAQGKEIKQNRKRNKSKDTPQKKGEKEETFKAADEQQPEEEEVHEVDEDQGESSPLVFSQRHQTKDSGQIFQKAYQHTPREKKSATHAAPDSHRQPAELLKEAEPAKRRRKPTGSWWMVDSSADNVEVASPKKRQPALKKSKPQKTRKEQPKRDQSPELSNNSNVDIPSEPAGGARVPPLKVKPLSAPKTVKRSLAKFTDIFRTGIETPELARSRDTQQKNRRNVTSHPAKETSASPSKTSKGAASIEGGDDTGTRSSFHIQKTPQDDKCQTESTSHVFRSGPSSMIELREYEEDDDSSTCLTSGVQAELSPSDLCSPPLKPLVLQSTDKSNLADWFKDLWSTPAKSDAAVTPDQFDWYFYQDKVMGLQVEHNTGSFCHGKMMLGSQMKKPLWVDHSATTVFNLLTSSVSVTIDGSESRFSSGQSFVVSCGHAYSIKNVTSLPAMLYFTRMSADSPDYDLKP